MSQVLVDPARLVAEGDVLWAIGHRVEASVRACEAALSSTGGMAGDEETARACALGDGGPDGYDGSATQVLQGALETVNALRSMDAALANTARAYDVAQLVGACREPSSSIFRSVQPALVSTEVRVPSALGPGPTTPLGEFGEFLQDALAMLGVVLPDADAGKIDAAERAWSDLAGSFRRARAEVDTSLHASIAPGLPNHARIASCRDGITRRLDTAATSADAIAAYARALGDAVAKAWDEIGWLIGQMAAEIMLEIGVGVALSFLTAGVGAAATAAKIAFTVGRWALRIAEVCRRLATLVRGALAAARITGRGAAHLVKDSIASGVAAVAAQIGFNELRAAVDPSFQRQGIDDILAGGLMASIVGRIPGRMLPTPVAVRPSDTGSRKLVGPIGYASPTGVKPVWQRDIERLPRGRQDHVAVVESAKRMRALFDRWTDEMDRMPSRGAKIPEVHRGAGGEELQWRIGSKSDGPAEPTIDIRLPDAVLDNLKVHLDR